MSHAELSRLGMLAPSKSVPSRAVPSTPRATYRVFMHALRHLQDPHVWLMATTHFRSLLVAANKPLPTDLPEGSASLETCKELKARATKHVKTQLNEMRAAVACHPHALTRLVEDSYGLRGRVKWDLIKHVTLSAPLLRDDWPDEVLDKELDPETRYPPMQLQPPPHCLRPLIKPTKVVDETTRARRKTPPVAIRRALVKEWEAQWANIATPLVLPPNDTGASTGWEKKGVVETMRHMAGLESRPIGPTPPRRQRATSAQANGEPLPSFKNLPPSLRMAFPRRPPSAYKSLPYFPPPRASLTRDQPKKWSYPRKLSPRLIRRLYKQVWDRLVWVYKFPYRTNTSGVRVGGWKTSTWEMVNTGELPSGTAMWRDGESRWTEAGERELKWIGELELDGVWDARKVQVAKTKQQKGDEREAASSHADQPE